MYRSNFFFFVNNVYIVFFQFSSDESSSDKHFFIIIKLRYFFRMKSHMRMQKYVYIFLGGDCLRIFEKTCSEG